MTACDFLGGIYTLHGARWSQIPALFVIMGSAIEEKDQLPVLAADEQDTVAAIETARATRLDAGLRSVNHCTLLPCSSIAQL